MRRFAAECGATTFTYINKTEEACGDYSPGTWPERA